MYVQKYVNYLCDIVRWQFFSCSGACVKIPGASVQCGFDSEGDEWSGEEEHSPNSNMNLACRVVNKTGCCVIIKTLDRNVHLFIAFIFFICM